MAFAIRSIDGKFWTGRRWCQEYPEAQLYPTQKKAEAALMAAGQRGGSAVAGATIVENYGDEEEDES